jgi:hypothetical protein
MYLINRKNNMKINRIPLLENINEGKRWKYTIDLSEDFLELSYITSDNSIDEFESWNESNKEKIKDILTSIIGKIGAYVQDEALEKAVGEDEISNLQNIVDEFEILKSSEDEDFDGQWEYVWTLLYDWADENDIWVEFDKKKTNEEKIDESHMSNLDVIRQESSDKEDFIRRVKIYYNKNNEKFGQKLSPNNDLLDEIWDQGVINDKVNESKIKHGKMHKLLGVDLNKKISDVYNSGKELANALIKKTNAEDAKKMLNMAANFNSGSDKTLFRAAYNAIKESINNTILPNKYKIPGTPKYGIRTNFKVNEGVNYEDVEEGDTIMIQKGSQKIQVLVKKKKDEKGVQKFFWSDPKTNAMGSVGPSAVLNVIKAGKKRPGREKEDEKWYCSKLATILNALKKYVETDMDLRKSIAEVWNKHITFGQETNVKITKTDALENLDAVLDSIKKEEFELKELKEIWTSLFKYTIPYNIQYK